MGDDRLRPSYPTSPGGSRSEGPLEGVGVRIVCLSDTHGRHRKVAVPDGDLLILAGDLTAHGKPAEVEEFDRWLGGLPHRHTGVDCFMRQG